MLSAGLVGEAGCVCVCVGERRGGGEVGRPTFGIRRISAAAIMKTVAPALRSGQDKLNLNSKVLKLFFFLPEFNHKKAGGRAVGRASLSGGVGGRWGREIGRRWRAEQSAGER